MHENIKKRPQSANHSKFPEAKSTKKYDAYVNMVKKIKR